VGKSAGSSNTLRHQFGSSNHVLENHVNLYFEVNDTGGGVDPAEVCAFCSKNTMFVFRRKTFLFFVLNLTICVFLVRALSVL
jgi:hypothetical protein